MKKRLQSFILFGLLTIGVIACNFPGAGGVTPIPVQVSPSPGGVEASPVPSPTVVSSSEQGGQSQSDLPLLRASPTPQPGQAEPHTWLPAPTPSGWRDEPTAAELQMLDILREVKFPENDPVALAVQLRGATLPATPADPGLLPQVGDVKSFWVSNQDSNTWTQVQARLVAATPHVAFWFDQGLDSVDVAGAQSAADQVEAIFSAARRIYGSEPIPGIDGDPRVYVLHVSPVTLCDVTVETQDTCWLLGYYSSLDAYPEDVFKNSNEHEMFILNGRKPVGTLDYFSTLVHEFRHMVENTYDRNDEDWEAEGTATMAQLLAGDTEGPLSRAWGYFQDLDLQLNGWVSTGMHPHYGKGYVFSRYLYDRFGESFYSAWVQHPGPGFSAIQAVLHSQGYDLDVFQVWQEYAVALALRGETAPPAPYTFSPEFGSLKPARQSLSQGNSVAGQVHQLGIDLYEIQASPGATTMQILFTGARKTALLEEVLPASGQFMWWSGRSNQSDIRLTRQVDLSGVTTATLEYAMFADIEPGYDFGYVMVSTDGEQTWTALQAPNMLVSSPENDPGNRAWADYFYTGSPAGNSPAQEGTTLPWETVHVDLTPFAGKVISLRFQYITDALLTERGWAIDNIAIPEISFYDDAETLAEGWVAEGFTRVTGYLPQPFQLSLVTFSAGGVPQVSHLPLVPDNTLDLDVSLAPGQSRVLLVVTAVAPLTLSQADYLLEVR